MIAALWPSDTTDLDTLLARIAEIQAGGDTVYCPLDVMDRAMALMTKRREMTMKAIREVPPAERITA